MPAAISFPLGPSRRYSAGRSFVAHHVAFRVTVGRDSRMMPGVKLRTIVWAGGLAAGAAVVGHAAMRTPEGPAVDRELFEALNAATARCRIAFFKGVTELGSLYAAGAAAGALAVLGKRRAAAQRDRRGGGDLGARPGREEARRPSAAVRGGRRDHPPDDREAARDLVAEQPPGRAHHVHAGGRARARARRRVPRGALGARSRRWPPRACTSGVHYPSDVASGLLMGRAVARIWPRWGRA